MIRRLTALAALGVLAFPQPAAAETILPRFNSGDICVEDVAHSRHPVERAAAQWSRAGNLDLEYRSGLGACNGEPHVIRVRSGYYGRTGWAEWGQFPRQVASWRQVAEVKLNDSYLASSSYSWAQRAYYSLHGTGHSLGLEHPPSGYTWSVMSYANMARTEPTARDFRVIYRLYPW